VKSDACSTKKGEHFMKYETPEMTVLMPAIKAIQSDGGLPKFPNPHIDSILF
jgi:hypothetical protein